MQHMLTHSKSSQRKKEVGKEVGSQEGRHLDITDDDDDEEVDEMNESTTKVPNANCSLLANNSGAGTNNNSTTISTTSTCSSSQRRKQSQPRKIIKSIEDCIEQLSNSSCRNNVNVTPNSDDVDKLNLNYSKVDDSSYNHNAIVNNVARSHEKPTFPLNRAKFTCKICRKDFTTFTQKIQHEKFFKH